MTTFDADLLRSRMNQVHDLLWLAPTPFGPDGWRMESSTGRSSVIVTVSDLPDREDEQWIHASMAHANRDPSYRDLVALHKVAFGDGWAYQVFAPKASHINIHDHALHLWGRLGGDAVLPDFGAYYRSI